MRDNLAVKFFGWYFMIAPARILGLGRDFLRWGWQYFSIGFLAPRLFAPWHRDITGYGRGFDIQRILRVLGWNLISRVVGAVMRLGVMIAGLVVCLFFAAATLAALVWWIVMPVLSLFFLVLSFINLTG